MIINAVYVKDENLGQDSLKIANEYLTPIAEMALEHIEK
jgi:hypothetical protein